MVSEYARRTRRIGEVQPLTDAEFDEFYQPILKSLSEGAGFPFSEFSDPADFGLTPERIRENTERGRPSAS